MRGVLVVERDARLAWRLGRWLAAGTVTAVAAHASTLRDAEAALERSRFEAIVLSLDLLDGRGVQAYERLRRAAPATPIVTLAGDVDEDEGFAALQAGAAGHLVREGLSAAAVQRAVAAALGPARRPGAGLRAGGTTTVAILGEQALLADAVAAMLESVGYAVTGVFGDPAALVREAGRPSFEVLVHLVGRGGLHRLRDALPGTLILVVADDPGPFRKRVLDGDADGLILTDDSASALAGAIEQVRQGHMLLPAGGGPVPEDPLAGLSTRQREVLELVAAGARNDEIARRLFISVNTVKFHVRTLYDRLGVHNRAQAAGLAARAVGRPALSARGDRAV